MTPAARVQAAAELLDQILDGTPAEKALTGWARRSRFAGSKDRAAIRDHVFDALRNLRSYGALGGARTGRGLMIGALRAAGQDPAELFTGQGHAPSPLTGDELIPRAPSSAEAMNLPDWLIPVFQDSLGDRAEQVAQTLQSRAPVMLRVNTRKGTRDQAIAALAGDSITAEPAQISDTALIVTEGMRKVNNSQAYASGLVELQDGGSQALVDRIAVQDGQNVLDYCAGGGGKTLAIAGRIQGKFYAHDANPRRLKDLPERACRASVSVQVVEAAQLSEHAPFDLVLCDVPCSGSGSWRRSPEAKWALSLDALNELNAIQSDILDKTHGLVGQSGSLVYATCSVLKAENQNRINAFLASHPDWRCEWQENWLPGPENDGFFAACLTRFAE
ncbi:RsmB/NOP family class I SAM-dependent RNA methyltransferase [Thalassovita sp.]|jgi:16S rRNA (cytosine967-C5)-methyltransferase|uniref:RsmB/NOP family class I SAM-dependent RNA methyltransferase n=1 Tax=Thalassovita sp. TaxID=1979401 RepID=UPI003B5B1C34